MRASKELAIIQSKRINELTEEDIRKLKILQSLKSKEIPDGKKIEYLLELIATKEQRQTYIDRFNENMPLIEEDEILSVVMEEKIATETVDYTLWRPTSSVVGKYCYTRANPESELVEGVGVQKTESRYRRDLQYALELHQGIRA